MWLYCLKIIFIFLTSFCFVLANGSTKSESLSNIARIEKCKKFCSCNDFLKSGGVYCEQYSKIYISNLTFFDYKKLTTGLLEGFYGEALILEDPTMTVDEHFLQGILSLERIFVKQSSMELHTYLCIWNWTSVTAHLHASYSNARYFVYIDVKKIKIIPDFIHVKYSIIDIRILSSRLTSLEGKNLQNLTLVVGLYFSNNYISYIDPDVFKGTDNIEVLDLSHNLLMYIPSKLLDPMKNLEEFHADHNNLLNVDNLFIATKPNYIQLSYNNITNVDYMLRTNMEDDCESLELNDENFRGVYKGEVLDLSFNCIKETPKLFFSCYMNAINDTPIFSIRRLIMDGNELKTLHFSLRNAEIYELAVSKTQIDYLTNEDFLFVYHTVNLQLQDNEIGRIDTLTFQPLRAYLTKLNLGFNKITSLNGSIRNLPVIFELSLSNNLIQFFAEDEFIGVTELSILYLDGNKIKNLRQLQHLSKLAHLDISHTAIESLTLDQVPKTLRSINLSDNNFKCDCHLEQFIGWIKTNKYIKTDTELCSHSDLQNSLKKRNDCPEMCSCRCFENLEFPSMLIDCSSKNLSVVPQFFLKNSIREIKAKEMITSEDRRFLVMDQHTYPSLYFEDRVFGISLENNSLKYIDAAILPPNLSLLYLSNNKLSWLPESIIDNQLNLKEVSLSGNPWKCDCNSLKFRNWLISMYRIILDIDKVVCEISDTGEVNLNGRIIWKLTDHDLCPMINIGLVASVSLCILLSFTIVCFTAKMLYRKHELNIKMYLYSRGFHFVKEENIKYDKEFDAFMSFSHKDDEFIIKEIISNIEKKEPNIRLCLHYRHFLAGEFISDNITYAVKNSSNTVLFLSRNFLESEWCLLEFRSAYMQSLQDRVHRIILVKIGELPKKINPAIKLYLDSTTYLTWGENRFWEKLFFVLPSSSSIRNPVPRHIVDNDIIFNCSFTDV